MPEFKQPVTVVWSIYPSSREFLFHRQSGEYCVPLRALDTAKIALQKALWFDHCEVRGSKFEPFAATCVPDLHLEFDRLDDSVEILNFWVGLRILTVLKIVSNSSWPKRTWRCASSSDRGTLPNFWLHKGRNVSKNLLSLSLSMDEIPSNAISLTSLSCRVWWEPSTRPFAWDGPGMISVANQADSKGIYRVYLRLL